VRRCAGCGERAPRNALRRYALADGRVVPDPAATLPGRGAWLHPARECLERALERGGFARAFKRAVTIPDDLVDSVGTWPRSASTS
jgi:predicted RNA-binding protein YlxR (DUF448 family)